MKPQNPLPKPEKRPADHPNLSPGLDNPTDAEHGVAEMGGQGMGKPPKKEEKR